MTRQVCTPDQLGKGVTVLSNTSNEIVRKKALLPGRVGVLVVGPDCKPLANEPFTLTERGETIKSGVTSASPKGVVELDLPIDLYELHIRGESFQVVAQDTGTKTVQVFQLQGAVAGIFDTRIPARSSEPMMGGREWLRWLGDPTTTKRLPFGSDKKYNPLGVMKTMTLDRIGAGSAELREHVALAEFRKGNMPAFCRIFKPVHLRHKQVGEATVRVTCDVLAIGSDDDFIRFPLGAIGAQMLASEWNCYLPTFKIVIACFLEAKHKLVGHPMPLDQTAHQRSNLATWVHEEILQGRLACDVKTLDHLPFRLPFKPYGVTHQGKCQMPLGRHTGELVSGHVKEVNVSHQQGVPWARSQMPWKPEGRLSMYGLWKGTSSVTDTYGQALPDVFQDFHQGPFARHEASYADYSHGVRLVHPLVKLKRLGSTTEEDIAYTKILSDPKLVPLLVDAEASDYNEGNNGWDRFGYDVQLPGTWFGTALEKF